MKLDPNFAIALRKDCPGTFGPDQPNCLNSRPPVGGENARHRRRHWETADSGDLGATGPSGTSPFVHKPEPASRSGSIRESPWLPTQIFKICCFKIFYCPTDTFYCSPGGLRKQLLASAPNDSIHKSSYSYAVHQAEHQERGPHARPAITHQRQGDSGHRHPAYHHPYIYQYMK